MNIVLITLGSHGDTNPFVGLGKTLKARGHRVTLAASGYFETQVRDAGLEFHAMGTSQDYETLARDPRLWDPNASFFYLARHGILPAVRPVYEFLREESASRKDTIAVASILSAFGAQIAREKLGIPLATAHLQPIAYRSNFEAARYPQFALPGWLPPFAKQAFWNFTDWAVTDRVLGPPINAFRKELGLPPARHFFGDGIHSPQLDIAFFPSWFARSQPDWPSPLIQAGFPVYDGEKKTGWPEKLDGFLDRGDPPIAFTFGTAMRGGDKLFSAAVEACLRLGRRAILLNSDPSQIPPNLSSSILHLPYASLSLLLPRCSALVHHGGIGSMARAFKAGLPQLAVSMSHDQPDNASRMEVLGCGLELKRSKLTVPSLEKTLLGLLSESSFRERAEVVARKFEKTTDAFDTAATALESIALTPPPSPPPARGRANSKR